MDQNQYSSMKKNTVDSRGQLGKNPNVRFDWSDGDGLRVMFLGNSITLHGVRPSVGWFNEWGMAASCKENDYVHLLMSAVRESHPDASFCVCQGADWETVYQRGSEKLEDYIEARDFGADIIVMRLIENCPGRDFDAEAFKRELHLLLSYLNPTAKAHVILTTGFWHHPGDDAIRSYGEEHELPVVKLGDLGEDDRMKAIGLFEHSGVANHPGDLGMQMIAERIFEVMKTYL